MTVPARRVARALVPAAAHEGRAVCGACGALCSGAGDMLCVGCLPFLPDWARRLYMAAWRSWTAGRVGPERVRAVRARCVAAAREQRLLRNPRPIVVVARGKTRPQVLAFLRAHPGSTLHELVVGAETAYKPTSSLVSLLRREGRLDVERVLGTTRHLRYTLKEVAP